MSRRKALVVCGVVFTLLMGTAFGAVSTIPASGDVSLQTNSGLTVTIESASEVPEQPFADSQTIQLQSGNLSAGGSANVSLPQASLSGSFTRLDGIDTNGNTVTVDPADKDSFSFGGDIDRLNVSETIAVDDNQIDFEYGGASGTSNVTVRGLAANTMVKAIDVDSNALLGSALTDGSGVAQFTDLPNSNHSVALTDDNTAPTLSNADPDGTVATDSATLSVDVGDADFTADDVTVTIDVNGTQQFQTTISSAQTVSTTVFGLPSGSNTWTVNATDTLGESTVESYSVNVPGNVSVYNESAPDTKLGAVDAKAYAQSSDSVYDISTTNGELPLTGLPADEYVLIVESSGYKTTAFYVDDIASPDNAFLLPTNVSTSEIIFELDDSTGRFGDETRLYVQRALNTSGTVSYETVVSDQFDASNQIATQLVNNERYRLKVVNADGEARVLGTYTPTGDTLVPLPIGNVVLRGTSGDGTSFAAQLEDSAGGRVIRAQYRDPDEKTSELRITIVEYGNTSNVLVDNQTVTGPFGTATVTYNVPASAPDDISYRVQYEAVKTGDDETGEVLVGDIPPIAEQFGLAPNVLSLLGWATIILVTGLVTIASAQLATVVAVLVATLMTFIGAVAIPFPLLGVAGAIAFMANAGRLTQ
jgi:hypothetical protein